MVGIPASSILDADVEDLALRICGSTRHGQIVRLRSRKCTIGSGPRCTLRLRSRGVQALHCLILRGARGAVIRRYASDTRLNGRAFEDAPLAPGDRLSVGPLEFEVLDAGTSHESESLHKGEVGEPEAVSQGGADQQAEALQRRQDEIDALAARLDERQQALQDQSEQINRARAELESQRQAFDAERRAWAENRATSEPPSERQGQELDARQTDLQSRQAELDARQAKLDLRQKEIDAREDAADARQNDLDARQAELDAGREALDSLQAELDARSANLDTRQAALDGRQAELDQRRAEMDRRHVGLQQREAETNQRRTEFDQRQAELDQRHAEIDQREADLEQRECELNQRQAESDERRAELAQRQAESDARESESDRRQSVREAERTSADTGCKEASGQQPDLQFEEPDQTSPGSSEEILRRLGIAASFVDEDEQETQREEPAPQAVKPHPTSDDGADSASDSDDDDESIDDYMAKLLDRVRSTAGHSSHPGAARPAADSAPVSHPSRESAPEAVDSPSEPKERATEPHQPGKLAPRAVAPERSVDLGAMRDLANLSAQAAINRHTRRKMLSAAASKLIVAIVSLAAGAALTWLWWAKSHGRLTFFAASASFVIGLFFALQYILLGGRVLFARANRKRKQRKLAADPSGSQPERPE